MQDVFSKNPKMGDPTSLTPQLDENSRTLDHLQQEIRKYEVDRELGTTVILSVCLFAIQRKTLLVKFQDVWGLGTAIDCGVEKYERLYKM